MSIGYNSPFTKEESQMVSKYTLKTYKKALMPFYTI